MRVFAVIHDNPDWMRVEVQLIPLFPLHSRGHRRGDSPEEFKTKYSNERGRGESSSPWDGDGFER